MAGTFFSSEQPRYPLYVGIFSLPAAFVLWVIGAIAIGLLIDDTEFLGGILEWIVWTIFLLLLVAIANGYCLYVAAKNPGVYRRVAAIWLCGFSFLLSVAALIIPWLSAMLARY